MNLLNDLIYFTLLELAKYTQLQQLFTNVFECNQHNTILYLIDG